MKNLLISAFASLLIFSMQLSLKAQNKVTWPKGQKMALSLTFDDGRASQVNVGTALLDKYGVKATLYVMPNAIEKNVALWKKAAENGHEIGNHSSLHPCSGNFAWSRNRALEEYTLEKMQKELLESNEQLHQMIASCVLPSRYHHKQLNSLDALLLLDLSCYAACEVLLLVPIL